MPAYWEYFPGTEFNFHHITYNHAFPMHIRVTNDDPDEIKSCSHRVLITCDKYLILQLLAIKVIFDPDDIN